MIELVLETVNKQYYIEVQGNVIEVCGRKGKTYARMKNEFFIKITLKATIPFL